MTLDQILKLVVVLSYIASLLLIYRSTNWLKLRISDVILYIYLFVWVTFIHILAF